MVAAAPPVPVAASRGAVPRDVVWSGLVLMCGAVRHRPDSAFAAKKMGFQLAIARLQLHVERNLLRLAAATGRPTIVVFDRGLLDGKAFCTNAEWSEIVAQLTDSRGKPIDEQYLLNRYDGVVHLVTAADGARDFYKSGNTIDDSGRPVIRHETPEEAGAGEGARRPQTTRRCARHT